MRGSEISLNLPEMKRWTPLARLSDTMQIKAMDNGELVLGVELRKSMTEKMQDMWKVEIYATDDMKVIVMQGDADKILDQLRVRRFICILTKTASVL